MRIKKVFITGAGSGLGKEAALALARRGHIVYASVHYFTEIAPMEEIAIKENLSLFCFCLDLLKEENRYLILQYDIDVLICNAAIGSSGSVCEVPISQIEKVFETNIFCHLKLVQLALRPMIESKKQGRIIFLTSLVGRIPMPFLSPYCASKFALDCFTTCLRSEMKLLNKLKKANIEIACIEPGAYATGFNKENNEKKYEWMYESSYFSENISYLRKKEKKIWNFLEQKPYTPIIKQYVKAVEAKKARHRYSAPWWQTFFVQLGRIFGM